jgi:dTDP-glucose 4,6-dehydratase
MKLLVTGGAGFIGSALVRFLVSDLGHEVLNIDKLTYAANQDSLTSVAKDSRYHFRQIDILDREAINLAISEFLPDGVFHLAAETHVDRSIENPDVFVESNVLGTQRLLSACTAYLSRGNAPANFRFLHISTDEVFGELSQDPTALFTEDTPYDPRSPYSASKAASDHLVRAWVNTYKFPALITNCSNNYGPFQNAEKLIPLTIARALKKQRLPVYGQGLQIRDWLFVDDHVRGLYEVFTRGEIGESYNIGGHNERRNIDVVRAICALLDKYVALDEGSIGSHSELISFVSDRPGHDFRYAIDASKMKRELDWAPLTSFDDGLEKTIRWYIDYYNRHPETV